MKKHKWHKEIIAWANGATIQFNIGDGKWDDCIDNDPAWSPNTQYRIKPEPKKLIYLNVYKDTENIYFLANDDFEKFSEIYIGKIKLEDDDNGND